MMDNLKGEESNLDSVQEQETEMPLCKPKENESEVNNFLSICNQVNVKGCDQQQFVNEAFNILTKLCDLKIEEKTNESDSASTELPMFLYRDISNRRQKLLLEAEYEFLIINACDILSRLLDRTPGHARLKYRNKHSLKSKHRSSKDRQLKEFYKAEECFNIAGFNEIMHRECIDFKTLDFKSFDMECSKDRACSFYDYSIIKGGKDWDLPLFDDSVTIRIYENTELTSFPDGDMISKAQFLFEQESMVWDSVFIENVLAVDKKFAGSTNEIPERKKSHTIIPNINDKKSDVGKLHKSYGSEYDEFFKPYTLLERISSSMTPQANVPPNSKNCTRKTGTRRTNDNLSTSAGKPNQPAKMGKVPPQQAVPEKGSLYSQLSRIDLRKVNAFKDSILQYIPKRNSLFGSSGEFENSLLGIGATLGLGKWWQQEFAKLQKEGFLLSNNTQRELKSIEKFMNTSFKEILQPVCHKQAKRMPAQPPVTTRKPKKVINNTDKKRGSYQENNQRQSPLRTKMNTNLLKRGDNKKNMPKKSVKDSTVENVNNAKPVSIPADKKSKVQKSQRYSAKFKTSNKLPNGEHPGIRNKAKFIKVKTPFKKTPFKILRTPINNYPPSKNQRVLLKNKPTPAKNTKISLKNQKTPLKNSRNLLKKSRTPFKNPMPFKKSLSARNGIPKDKIKKF